MVRLVDLAELGNGLPSAPSRALSWTPKDHRHNVSLQGLEVAYYAELKMIPTIENATVSSSEIRQFQKILQFPVYTHLSIRISNSIVKECTHWFRPWNLSMTTLASRSPLPDNYISPFARCYDDASITVWLKRGLATDRLNDSHILQYNLVHSDTFHSEELDITQSMET